MVRDTSARMGNPEAAMTLTSVDPDRDTSTGWSRDVEHVIRALRRRWSEVEYLLFMEWTSGRGPRSGGRRRPHGHLLLRGLPREATERAEAITRRVWETRTGAYRVEVAPLRAAEDGVAYLALHHLKPSQAAPENWRGRRLRPSKGWWGANARELRQEAEQRVADRAHHARVTEERRAAIAAYVEQGLEPDMAADLVLGTAEDPRPVPDREPVEVVLLRRAGAR
jgi:hypothetical protein